jgi:hypothetical protein
VAPKPNPATKGIRINVKSFLILFPLALLGCTSSSFPENVKISINSEKVLAVKDFEFEPASAYRGCTVSGTITYDISVDPADFTGIVFGDDAVLSYAGAKERKVSYMLPFKNGKLNIESSLSGFNVFDWASDENTNEEKAATCASKSSSKIRLISLGVPNIAVPGVDAAIVNDSKKSD